MRMGQGGRLSDAPRLTAAADDEVNELGGAIAKRQEVLVGLPRGGPQELRQVRQRRLEVSRGVVAQLVHLKGEGTASAGGFGESLERRAGACAEGARLPSMSGVACEQVVTYRPACRLEGPGRRAQPVGRHAEVLLEVAQSAPVLPSVVRLRRPDTRVTGMAKAQEGKVRMRPPTP
jgi:hypothetical protein